MISEKPSTLILNFLKRFKFRKKGDPIPLVNVGIGYSSHVVSQCFNAGHQYRVIAYIDDEPWSHRTVINEGVVHYPVELQALVKRNFVRAVIFFEDEKSYFSDSEIAALVDKGALIIKVPEKIPTHLKVNYIQTRLKSASISV